ncbi:metalloprotease PmbA [Solemya velum gill symbiont]|uniref:metalloprotease PmbA n=1 Tax=Solemya velum gill symbiont TaxID=2340 RepID=UPI00099898A2|nr:metalloprotease PmbA [Solemya velum gill symbiont]OOZ80193.1 metalloprotease PmbA [Solemya velum gill symbiont]
MSFDASAKQAQLQSLVDTVLNHARKKGASAAEVAANSSHGIAATVRLGEVETIENTADNGLGITVYYGQCKGSASTSDLSEGAIDEALTAACDIAKYAAEDPCAGLPDENRLAKEWPDLDLYHPWQIPVEETISIATACETAARSYDERITNSDGATVNQDEGVGVYGNSLGFIGGYPSSRQTISCSVLASENDDMQRDYWYSTARDASELESVESIGRRAAERTISRLGARKLSTRSAPILFKPEVAAGLLRNFIGAISGGSLYRKSSFLLDSLGQQVFPEWINIHEDPLKPGGLASAPFDSEGVATSARDIVADGIIQGYVLSSYSARRLGMETTGNAGGVRNLTITPNTETFEEMVAALDTGLILTEMMGQGLNMVTGDYSRGAAGFWVENGEILYPVEEITIAGNMKQMLMDLLAVGNDADYPGSIQTGSWLIREMMIAGE